MIDRTIEAAMWRIWYGLHEEGELTRTQLIANYGVCEPAFDRAIQGLADMKQIEQTTKNGEQAYLLHDQTPRIMQVLPTISNIELEDTQ